MDVGGDWKLLEPDAGPDEPARAPSTAVVPVEHMPRWLVPAIAAIVCVAVGLAIWATLPTGGVTVDAAGPPFVPREHVVGGAGSSSAPSSIRLSAGAQRTQPASAVVVDIEGAVARPGIHELIDGSRLGDAIDAAGGYAPTVDLAAASRALNLAARLTDGQQIHVPALGEAAVPPTSGTQSNSGTPSGGLIDLNHASAEELDTLPGIGPVTAAKIIDARTQAPFATVDELQSRSVVGPSTFEKLRDLVTVTP